MNNKIVGFLFLGLAGLSLVVRLAYMAALLDPALLVPAVYQGLSFSIGAIIIALTYMLLNQCTQSSSVAVLGLIHFVFALIGVGLSIYGGRLIFTGHSPANIGLYMGLSGAALLVGNLLFMIALIVGLNSRPKTLAPDLFG